VWRIDDPGIYAGPCPELEPGRKNPAFGRQEIFSFISGKRYSFEYEVWN